jgi:thioredoxin reductase
VLTDSGGIQEEAPSLGKPVLVMRDTTERPEGVEAGTLKLVGTEEQSIYLECKKLLTDENEYKSKAVIVSTGCKNRLLGLPKEEDFIGNGISFCVACDGAFYKNKTVAVIGGGNTAMDSCRTAKRLGAEKVFIVYRRSEAEMPARLEEVKHAKEEGIEFLTLHNPLEYIADEKGAVKQVVLQKMELGEPDASGRRSPVAIPGATVTLDIDMAVVAVGVSPNPIVPTSIKGLELGRKNTIAVNEKMQSSIPTIFAGGDIVRGGATVILAMGDGRKAAASMHEELSK